MKTLHCSLVLGALLLSLALGSKGLAQDVGITSQIAKIKRCLPDSEGRALDLKGLKTAATSLTEKWPGVLQAPAAREGDKEYQVDSATGDEPASAHLALTEHQRMALLNAYQDRAEAIAAIAKRKPFDSQAADDIKGALAALQQFMTRLQDLVPMDRDSDEYKRAVETMVNEEQHKNK